MGWLVIVSVVCLGAVIFVLRSAQSEKRTPRKQATRQDQRGCLAGFQQEPTVPPGGDGADDSV